MSAINSDDLRAENDELRRCLGLACGALRLVHGEPELPGWTAWAYWRALADGGPIIPAAGCGVRANHGPAEVVGAAGECNSPARAPHESPAAQPLLL